MFVEVGIIVQYVALGLHALVTSGTARLLDVVFEGIGYVEMDDEPDVALVDPHTEGRSSDDDVELIADEGFLIFDLLLGRHLAVKGLGGKAIGGQFLGELDGAAGT